MKNTSSKAFPFLLTNIAKNWLYYLTSSSITYYKYIKRLFLKKNFLTSRATTTRKEIYGVRQQYGETLYEY